MDHINKGPYQLLKNDPTTKIKVKTFKELKTLKESKFKPHFYPKPLAPRFYGLAKCP